MEVLCLIFLLTLVVFLVLFFIPFLLLLFLCVQYQVLSNILDRTPLYFFCLIIRACLVLYGVCTGYAGGTRKCGRMTDKCSPLTVCFRYHTNKPQDKNRMVHDFYGVHKNFTSGLLGNAIVNQLIHQ